MGDRIRSWITVAGLDVVRDSDGSFKVLEDNLRTPSGIAYAVDTREVLGAHLRPPDGLRVLHATAGNLFGGVERMLLTIVSAQQSDATHEVAVCFDGRLAREP